MRSQWSIPGLYAAVDVPGGWGRPRRARRRAFTLVELLVVIVIIGILVGMAAGVVISARNRATTVRISNEISGLELALRKYQSDHGEFPPDFSGCYVVNDSSISKYQTLIQNTAQAMVVRHLSQAFPRYVPGIAPGTNGNWNTFTKFTHDLQYYTGYNPTTRLYILNYGMNPQYLDAASSLVFWLAGPTYITSMSGGTIVARKPNGFAANPLNPFDPTSARLPSLFEFEESRLLTYPTMNQLTGGTAYIYEPPSGRIMNRPYVYFRATNGKYYTETNNGTAATFPALYPPINVWKRREMSNGILEPDGVRGSTATLMTHVRPYFNGKTFTFYNSTSFQIIAPGSDGLHGGTFADRGAGMPGGIPQAPAFPDAKPNNTGTATPNWWGMGHDDNITNFTARGTIADLVQGQ